MEGATKGKDRGVRMKRLKTTETVTTGARGSAEKRPPTRTVKMKKKWTD